MPFRMASVLAEINWPFPRCPSGTSEIRRHSSRDADPRWAAIDSGCTAEYLCAIAQHGESIWRSRVQPPGQCFPQSPDRAELVHHIPHPAHRSHLRASAAQCDVERHDLPVQRALAFGASGAGAFGVLADTQSVHHVVGHQRHLPSRCCPARRRRPEPSFGNERQARRPCPYRRSTGTVMTGDNTPANPRRRGRWPHRTQSRGVPP